MRKSNLSENEIIDLISQYQSSIKKLEFQRNSIRETVRDLQGELKELQRSKSEQLKAAKAAEKKATAKVPVKKPTKTETTAKKPILSKPKRRGRPRKDSTVVKTASPETASTETASTKTASTKTASTKTAAPATKKPATTAKVSATPTKAPKKRRGRPPKSESAKAKSNGKAAITAKKTPAAKKPATTQKKDEGGKGYRLSDWDNLIMNAVEGERQMTRGEILDFVASKGGTLKKNMNDKQVSAKVSNVLHKLTNTRGLLKKGKNADKKPAYSRA